MIHETSSEMDFSLPTGGWKRIFFFRINSFLFSRSGGRGQIGYIIPEVDNKLMVFSKLIASYRLCNSIVLGSGKFYIASFEVCKILA